MQNYSFLLKIKPKFSPFNFPFYFLAFSCPSSRDISSLRKLGMSKKDSSLEGEGYELLKQFEQILESDPLIDEVGYIHPSQFASLNEDAKSSKLQSKDETLSSEIDAASASISDDTHFWNKDHKLGISTLVLLPLYKAARDAFMDAIREYKRLERLCSTSEKEINSSEISPPESKIMNHSKALLLLSCDFGTAWNSRKSILSKKQHLPMFISELFFSALVLSYSPKSEQAWCHRRWAIKMIAGKCSTMLQVVERESELVEKIAERSKMNYRAWNHRSWLVSFMTLDQVLLELKKSMNWVKLHIADNSCFHYRTLLLLRILEEFHHKNAHQPSDLLVEIYQIWQEELHWNEELIKNYIGREALWLYRRFLSLCWMMHFRNNLDYVSQPSNYKYSISTDINLFLEYELHLVNSFSAIPDNDYEDFQAQAVHSAAYILWLAKRFPEAESTEFREKLNAGNWKVLLDSCCPERSSLWSNLAGYLESP